MKRIEQGKVTYEHLDELEQDATRYPRPWTMGISSHVVAALVKEVREYRNQPCIECGDHRGWRVEPHWNTGDAVQVQCRACSEHVCPKVNSE